MNCGRTTTITTFERTETSGLADTVFLIDASIYIFQAWFSTRNPVFCSAGRDQSAFHGFGQFLLRFLRQTRARHLAAAFDESLFCGFRHQLCPDYKANRALPDEELARQLQACASLCDLLGISAYGSRTYEADDIIGSIAAGVRQDADCVCIVSRDKDLAQLLNNETDHLWDFSGRRKRFRCDVLRQYGIAPEQFPDYLGLIGDSSDNIAGVPGIGPVAAASLLGHFRTMDALYERLDEVASLSYRGARTGASLLSRYRKEAELARTLATIVVDVDDPAESFAGARLPQLRRRDVDIAGLQSLFAEQGLSARTDAFLRSFERLI